MGDAVDIDPAEVAQLLAEGRELRKSLDARVAAMETRASAAALAAEVRRLLDALDDATIYSDRGAILADRDALARIVRAMSAARPTDVDLLGGDVCGCCRCAVVRCAAAWDPADHHPACAWRQAHEWCAANPEGSEGR
jgi:hypothetical protein